MLNKIKNAINTINGMVEYYTDENSDIIDSYLYDSYRLNNETRFKDFVLKTLKDLYDFEDLLINFGSDKLQKQVIAFYERLDDENTDNFFEWFLDNFYDCDTDYFFNITIENTGYWMPNNAFDCISIGEIEIELESDLLLNSPFKTGIIDYIERKTDCVINDSSDFFAYVDLSSHCVVFRLDWQTFLDKADEFFEQ